ncbi:hypothetical protein [uncultured Bacteroides sp.]|uniref:hypothetical protein n=1 Tax=uncultured Bacteroides sp. TaxID=162156 RepID=UPI002605987B|nr:hypothetical protein [uncultured Bacteroides sp.]
MMKDLFENNSSRYTAFQSRFGGAGSWMRRFFRIRVAAAAVVAMFAAGCEDELVNSVAPESDPRAIVFEFDAPDFAYATADGMPATRTIPSMTAFPDGAIIHVIGTFTHEGGTTTSAYGTYAFNKSAYRWVAQGQTLLWPEHATTADFEAFYLPDSLGTGKVAQIDIVGERSSSGVFALAPPYISANDSIVHTDPLRAEKKDVNYGAAVQMRFYHVCSRLILTDVGDMETDECWLEYTTGSEKTDPLTNGYQFVIKKNEAGEYNGAIEFVQYDKMKSESGIHYVRARMEKDELTLADKTTTPVNALCFYLAPGQYKGCRVLYRDEKPFLTLGVNELEDPGLKGGTSYTLDIRTAQGVVNDEWVDPEKEWEGEEKVAKPLDLLEFMEALRKGEDYVAQAEIDGKVENNVQLLTAMGNNTVRVNYDIDFANRNMYTVYKENGRHFGKQGDDPGCVVGVNVTIDGNHKRFIHMASPLFDESYGIIRDLQIKNANISIPDEDILYDEGSVHSCRNVGALATYLRGGLVENVLLDSVKVTMELPQLYAKHGDDRHTHGTAEPSAGALFGEVWGGTAQNISVQRYIEVDVKQKTGVDKALGAQNTAFVGGLIGRQVSGFSSGISAIGSGTTITVTVNLKSERNGWIEVGGVVGFTSSNISDVQLMNCETKVDATNSQCGEIYVGGIVGHAKFTNATARQLVQDAYVRGTVKGGTATTAPTVDSDGTESTSEYTIGHSATGGIAGCLTSFSMLNCRFSGSVDAGKRLADQKDCVLISTGGGIGRIWDAKAGTANENGVCHVFECTVRATVTAPNGGNVKNLTGSFIGHQNIGAEEYRLDPYYGAGPADNCYACPPTTDEVEVPNYRLSVPATGAQVSYDTMPANVTYGNKNTVTNGNLKFCGALYEDDSRTMTIM